MNELDKNFKQLLVSAKAEAKPSPRFSLEVMDKVFQIGPRMVYKPVIGKWSWAAIACSFALFVIYAILNGTGGESSFLQPVQNQIHSVTSHLNPDISGSSAMKITEFFLKIPSLVYLIIIAIFVLVSFDRVISVRREKPVR